MKKEKIFAIPIIQKKLVEKFCFGSCGKIQFGGLHDQGYEFFPCREEVCPHEEKRLEYGTCKDGIIWLRKLKDD